MRLWSLHPKYLDAQGLVALWRESLLAQAVLSGETRGYRNHPQLDRFKVQEAPLAAIGAYLHTIHGEASERGYSFKESKIKWVGKRIVLPVTTGQIEYEWAHLMAKLRRRSPAVHKLWHNTKAPQAHPLMRVRRGPIESWERGSNRP